MKRKALALTIILAILFLAVTGSQTAQLSSANFFPDPGPDLQRIYIRNDGSVEPATVPIERTGNLYKLTDNIVLYTIEIQRDNIVLDGAGYTIQGNASRIKGYDDGNNGVIVAGRKNVNITRLNFEQGDTGIRISSSSHITVVNNSFTNGIHTAITLRDSTLVLIEANNFADLQTDIGVPSVRLHGSRNTFRNNTLTGSYYGIDIEGSSNVISDNKIEIFHAIELNEADANIIAGNTITGGGIWLFASCSDNMIFGNNITGSIHAAIRITDGSNNNVYGNYMANNQVAIDLDDDGAVSNTFYGNTFAADSCKVRIYTADVAEGTFWDNGTIGNCWGDYNGTDSNGDGIGDAPYVIVAYKWDNDVGGDVSYVSGQDNYPLMSPYDFEHDTIVLPQTGLFIAVLAAAVVIAVGAGLLVYFKKHKREAKPT
jgi:parallel beta-helix repeat protein